MATVDEMNAGFDALNVDIHHLVEHFVPRFFQGQFVSHIESADGRNSILDGVKRVLEAAEKVRAKAEKK